MAFKFFPDLFEPFLDALMTKIYPKIFSVPLAQIIFFKSIKEICSNCFKIFTEKCFTNLLSFIEQYIETINVQNCLNAFEALVNVCWVVKEENYASVVHWTLEVAVKDLPNLQFTPENLNQFLKAIKMLTGCVNALIDLDNLPIIEQTLLPILSSLPLSEGLYAYWENDSVVESVCVFFDWSIWALESSIASFFIPLVQTLVQCFQARPKNIKCIRTISFALEHLGHLPEIQDVISSSFEELSDIIISQVKSSEDSDIVQIFAELLSRIMQSPSLPKILLLFFDYLSFVNEEKSIAEIIIFLNHLIQNSKEKRY
jgi:hypothetical protein